MTTPKDYFFCGIGGSGMMPLALIVAGKGHHVAGSDRSLDQGRTAPKFEWLRSKGIDLFAQDGSGITRAAQIVVASTAVEETVPDIIAANTLQRVTRRNRGWRDQREIDRHRHDWLDIPRAWSGPNGHERGGDEKLHLVRRAIC
jgi:UDP-N-acetylmuramate-alanine ligase